MEEFANYILSETNLNKKIEIVYYLQKKTPIFFETSTILKVQLAKMFIEEMNIDVDENLVITACLLYSCKKKNNPQDLITMKAYVKDSSEFLKTLGFSDEFCQICEGHTRYYENDTTIRRKESDILELVEQFGGMLMTRAERKGFSPEDAICLLEFRNLKGKHNIYLEQFKEFVAMMEKIKI